MPGRPARASPSAPWGSVAGAMVRRLLPALAVLGLLGAGCGNSDDTFNPLPEVAISDVNNAQQRIEAACRPGGAGPTPELGSAVDSIVNVAARYPDGEFETGQTNERADINVIVADTARRLRDCGAGALAARLNKFDSNE